jgi:hypothetical membrane protein
MKTCRLAEYLAYSMPIIFVVGLAYVVSQNPWFSFTHNALSDMGSLHNPKGYIFNDLVMTTAAVGFGAAVLFMTKGHAYLLPFAMAALFLVGVFPEELKWHGPSAVLFYLLALLDITVVGLKMYASGSGAGALWSILGMLTLITIVLMAKYRWPVRGLAVPELIGAVVILSWVVYLGTIQCGGLTVAH